MTTAHELPRLSAHSLRILEECPRKFALRYKLNRYWPAVDPATLDASRTERVDIGQAFHRLAETQGIGLDPELLLRACEFEWPGIRALWERFLVSEHGSLPKDSTVWTEQALHFHLEGVPCMVRFDRLIHGARGWTILDWKTGKVVPAEFRSHWQTKLYLFALIEAGETFGRGAIRPADVMLVYWDVSKGLGHPVTYDAAAHEAMRRELSAKAREVLRPFDPWAFDDPNFSGHRAHCPRCVYDSLCNSALVRPPRTEPPMPHFVLEPVPLDLVPDGRDG